MRKKLNYKNRIAGLLLFLGVKPSVSTGIRNEATYGYGKLGDYGYWQYTLINVHDLCSACPYNKLKIDTYMNKIHVYKKVFISAVNAGHTLYAFKLFKNILGMDIKTAKELFDIHILSKKEVK